VIVEIVKSPEDKPTVLGVDLLDVPKIKGGSGTTEDVALFQPAVTSGPTYIVDLGNITNYPVIYKLYGIGVQGSDNPTWLKIPTV
jgi:hypothetical protein